MKFFRRFLGLCTTESRFPPGFSLTQILDLRILLWTRAQYWSVGLWCSKSPISITFSNPDRSWICQVSQPTRSRKWLSKCGFRSELIQSYFVLLKVNWIMVILLEIALDLVFLLSTELVKHLSVVIIFSMTGVDWIVVVDTECSSDDLPEHFNLMILINYYFYFVFINLWTFNFKQRKTSIFFSTK